MPTMQENRSGNENSMFSTLASQKAEVDSEIQQRSFGSREVGDEPKEITESPTCGTSSEGDSPREKIHSSTNSSEEEAGPDESWYLAASILLALKNSSEARIQAAANGSVALDELSVSHSQHTQADESSNSPLPDTYEGTVTTVDLNEASTEDSDDQDENSTCPICHKIYSRPSTLKAHMRTHTGERPFQCDVCNKSFSQDANLKAHLRVHSKEKPFQCHVCHRRFAQSSSVTTHMRIHSGERPYKCKVCARGFADSSTLTKHLRTHTGEKPYHCHVCGMSFSQSGNLSRHMRVHKKKK